MATEFGRGVSEAFLREREATRTEIARNTSSETFASIYLPGFPSKDAIERSQTEKATEQDFLAPVDHLIEQRQHPTAEALAASTGCPLEEAAEWLAKYCKNRIDNQEASERARIQRGADAQGRVNTAQRALHEAEETLKRSRDAKHLPPVDFDDPYLETTDPLIATAIRLRDELASTKAKYGYLAEVSRGQANAEAMGANKDSRRDQVRAAVAGVQDAMRSHTQSIKRTQELRVQLDRLRLQIVRSHENQKTTHRNIVRAHSEFWRLTGALVSDYAIPPRPDTTD